MANRVRSSALIGGVAVVAVLLLMAQRGQAQTVASDRAAGYVVFPKVLVDSTDIFTQGRKVDTLIQLTNTAEAAGSDTGCRVVECVYVDATMHCTNDVTRQCRTSVDCATGGTCGRTDDWQERNFFITLSAGQAIGWSADSGATLPADAACGTTSQTIPFVPEKFFIGELKCVELQAQDGPPLNANDLKGEATIYEVATGVTPTGGVDVRSYNGVGLQAIKTDLSTQSARCVGGTNQGTACTADAQCLPTGVGVCLPVLCLGSNPATGAVCGSSAQAYAGCPSTLILNHWFDGALNPKTENPITTDLTLVPCTEDLRKVGAAATPATTVQFLVYNEFEQRFSASTSVRCFKETQLSRIDTLPGNDSVSIFNFSVQGTLTGQTRIRPINGTELDKGHGLLGVAEEFSRGSGLFPRGSAAFDLDFTGTPTGKADVVTLHVSTP
ncbi:MAG: hypothetical protein ACHQ9S_16565 [Candidatus Binatia bacterium]